MSDSYRFDAIIIGAGIVGLAIAQRLSKNFDSILLVEKEETFGRHVSSRNSEVIHSGIYYPQNSLKARLCIAGNKMLVDFARKYAIHHKNCGKLIVSFNKDEDKILDKLFSDGINKKISGLEYISSKYSAMISSSESMKYIKDFISRKDLGSSLGDVKYIDDLSDELYDVKCFSSSLDSGEPFLYIMSGISKGIESYSRFFITELKSFMKENQLKASRTEIYLSWDLDKFEIRGNKILFHNALLNKIADLVGNVTELNDYFSQNSKRVISLPLSEKKQLLIICSK